MDSNLQQWMQFIKSNSPKSVSDEVIARFKQSGGNYNTLDDFILFLKIAFWLGVGVPATFWIARRIYRSIKKTKEEINTK